MTFHYGQWLFCSVWCYVTRVVVERQEPAATTTAGLTQGAASLHGPVHVCCRQVSAHCVSGGTQGRVTVDKACVLSNLFCLALLQVLEAAVVGVPHPKWGERPLLVVVPQSQYAPGEHVKAVTGFRLCDAVSDNLL